MRRSIKTSLIFALIVFLLIILAGALYMYKTNGIAVVNIDNLYQKTTAGEKSRQHLLEVKEILEQGLKSADETFKEQKNKEMLMLNVRKKLENQFSIEQNNVFSVFNNALSEAIKQWQQDNPFNTIVLPAGGVLAYANEVDITGEIAHKMDKVELHFNELPQVKIQTDEDVKGKANTPVAGPVEKTGSK